MEIQVPKYVTIDTTLEVVEDLKEMLLDYEARYAREFPRDIATFCIDNLLIRLIDVLDKKLSSIEEKESTYKPGKKIKPRNISLKLLLEQVLIINRTFSASINDTMAVRMFLDKINKVAIRYYDKILYPEPESFLNPKKINS